MNRERSMMTNNCSSGEANEIGGFLGLELPVYDNFPQHTEASCVLLNSGRSAFEYILRCWRDEIQRIWLPYYTCLTVRQPLERLAIPYCFYHINEDLEPEQHVDEFLQDGDWLVYTNYFGIKEACVDRLCEQCQGRLIIDQALAFYSSIRDGIPAFYSPRKFSGVPDGGIAVPAGRSLPDLSPGISFPWASFLLAQAEMGVEKSSSLCERNEDRLSGIPMQGMSLLTEKLMRGIDYESAAQQRRNNFLVLKEHLDPLNRMIVDLEETSVPFCYPFWTGNPELRNALIDQKIWVPIFWPQLLEDEHVSYWDRRAAMNIIPLPIDQFCNQEQMLRIVSVIQDFFR